jgi:membrane protease YdiL (CAAX protease family)
MAAALAAVALLAWPAWTLLHPHFDFPFHRIAERVGMLALLVGFLALARHLGLTDRASLGYGAPRRIFMRELGIALLLGVASMLTVVGLMASLGLLEWRSGSAGAQLVKLLATSALSGFAVAFIEETFLRGAMHTAIERESGTSAAVLLTALLYAATHFFAKFHIPPEQVNPHSGLDLLAGTLHEFAHPVAIVDAFLALAAVGVVLGLVRAATGNIAACIGLHAGWVWVMLVAHGLTQPRPGAALGFLLSRFDGFVGWLVLGWTLLLAVPLWRFYAARAGAAGKSHVFCRR